jgi:hypothetical protein
VLPNNSIDEGKVTEEDEEREMSGKEDSTTKPASKIPSLKSKMHHTHQMNQQQPQTTNLPTTASKSGEAALTGISLGFIEGGVQKNFRNTNNEMAFGKLIDFSRTGGIPSGINGQSGVYHHHG